MGKNRTVTINGNSYPAKDITFNTVCEFEDMGIKLSELEKKSTMLLRAYAAVCMGCDADKAGAELGAHIMSGGDLKEVAEALNKAIEESDFFQALAKRTAETNGESTQTAE